MRAQVSLTTAESKKLIAMAISKMDIVKKALKEGTVVIHPSSSTIFLAEELMGKRPDTRVWVCGVIVPKGACIEGGAYHPGKKSAPTEFSYSWILKGNTFKTSVPLAALLEELGPDDVYIKGANALDTQGNVGILAANEIEGGTFGVVMSAQRRRGFKIVFTAGLEKLIPISIKDAAREARRAQLDYSMGMSCNLVACEGGPVITEVEAIKMLSGATAVPVAAGGLAGAEGAITMIIKGETEQVKPAIKYIEEVKGAKLPLCAS